MLALKKRFNNFKRGFDKSKIKGKTSESQLQAVVRKKLLLMDNKSIKDLYLNASSILDSSKSIELSIVESKTSLNISSISAYSDNLSYYESLTNEELIEHFERASFAEFLFDKEYDESCSFDVGAYFSNYLDNPYYQLYRSEVERTVLNELIKTNVFDLYSLI